MEIIKEARDLYSWIYGKSNSFVTKILTTAVVLFVFIAIDFNIGLTFYYSINNKIQNIDKIEAVKIKYSSNKPLYEYFNQMEQEVLKKKTIYSVSDDFLVKLHTNKIINIAYNNINSPFLHLITSCGFWILAFFIFPFIVKKGSSIMSLIPPAIIIIVIVFVYYYMLGLIPFIHPLVNYPINIIIQVGTLWLFAFLGKKARLKREKAAKS